jgi:hypothetical protein
MFGGMAFKVGMLAKKGGGGGGDVTPDSVDFGFIDLNASPVDSDLVTFTGIDTTITLRISISDQDHGGFYYIKNGGSEVQINAPQTLNVSLNDTLKFRIYGTPGQYVIYYVYNESDGDFEYGPFQISRSI